MKILFISDVYFPRVNGVSTSIRTFVYQMQEMGHEVHLIAPDYGIVTEDEAWIKRVPARQIYFDPEDRLMRYGAALKMLPDLRNENYDVIHIHTPFVAHYLGLKLAHLLDIPCLETYHTFFEDYLHHYLPWIPQSMARNLAISISRRQCNAVNAVVAPSQPMLNALREYGVKASAEVIPTGLQAKSFEAANGDDFRDRHGIARDRPVALFVGRVAFEKNIDFLLRMANELRRQQPDMLLVIAGEGPAEKHLHALSQKLELADHIRFIGYLDRNTELNACYRAADVFVFASKTETQGLVLLEAMAQGVPVVALAELGTKSILIEGEGAMIAPEDERIFAAKVFSLFSNPGKRAKLGEAAQQYAAKRWTSRIQAERMLQFYQRVLSRNAFHALHIDTLKTKNG
ncbi:glycosyltransferase [Methylobacillus gramineus]|uniref:glycosyltransferase n=1 Tax=Methylobacillus gramineus TaxID=755169 RepID=UPI001CFF8C9E|nr:glycosyltransferase [Methylobacillus gramineus]MCB5184867.1 glycosyltransferase [Methylobacillus gramineus]